MSSHWILAVMEILWVFGIGLWIVLEKRSPVSTLAWVFGMAFLPIIGFVVYLLLGPRRIERKRKKYLTARALRGDEAALRHLPAVSSDVIRQVRLAAASSAPLHVANELQIFQDGPQLFAAMDQAIAAARHHVHLEYYIWEPDNLGRELRDRLIERARAGIEVRLLVDALGSPRADRKFFEELTKAGGEVAFFNPPRFYLPSFRFLNFRTHRKIVVVDGAVAFSGGMNVSVTHTSGSSGEVAWRDTHLRLAGPAVWGLQMAFLDDWQFAAHCSPQGAAYFPCLAVGEGPNTYVQVVASGPDRSTYPIHELVVSAISAADERVWIVSPYLVPDEALLTALKTAGHRGVDVQILVPCHGDSGLVTAAMRSFFDEMLESGVKLFEYLPGMHHAKTLIVDDELAIVGTANLDNRSFRLNFEVVVAIHGGVRTEELALSFENDLKKARPITAESRSALPFPRRLAEASARLFAPVL
ncbi:MAG: cardiolipin synthase [Acidobacteriota bacterium]